jgi:thioredoxin reductase (NADPH)
MEHVIIIGAGCAGYTAAIYTARANLTPLLLTGTQPGGQLTTTTEVENFPGFPGGIMGPELMMSMQQQAEKFGARIAWASVESIDRQADGSFKLNCGSDTYETKTLIVATGAAPRHLGLPNEKGLIGHGLTSCATCDGAFYRDVPVAVIGGGRQRLRGSLIPHPLCQQGLSHPSPRRAPRLQDHGRPRLGKPQDRTDLELHGRRVSH